MQQLQIILSLFFILFIIPVSFGLFTRGQSTESREKFNQMGRDFFLFFGIIVVLYLIASI